MDSANVQTLHEAPPDKSILSIQVRNKPKSLPDDNNEAESKSKKSAKKVRDHVARVLERSKITQVTDAVLSVGCSYVDISAGLNVSLCKTVENMLVLALFKRVIVAHFMPNVNDRIEEKSLVQLEE